MKVIVSVALFASAVAASAIPRTDVSNTFHIKTSGSSNGAHNDLFVYAYHTGAGLNDAVLTANIDDASSAYVNSTSSTLFFPLESSLTFGAQLDGDTSYDGTLIKCP